MHLYRDISNSYWSFSVTSFFVVTIFGHDENNAKNIMLKISYSYVLCIFIALFMIIFKVTLKVLWKKIYLTSVISLRHLYRGHVLSPVLWPNSFHNHQINTYFSYSFEKYINQHYISLLMFPSYILIFFFCPFNAPIRSPQP